MKLKFRTTARRTTAVSTSRFPKKKVRLPPGVRQGIFLEALLEEETNVIRKLQILKTRAESINYHHIRFRKEGDPVYFKNLSKVLYEIWLYFQARFLSEGANLARCCL